METKKRGPYKKSTGYSFLRTISTDQQTVETLTAFGDGNLSQGIRMAAAFIGDWQNHNGLPPAPPSICHVL